MDLVQQLERAKILYVKAATHQQRTAVTHAEEMVGFREQRPGSRLSHWRGVLKHRQEELARQEAHHNEIFDQVVSGKLEP